MKHFPIIGTMAVRNEQWVLGCSLRVALRWCDEIVVLDHGSTDATPQIIADVARENPGRVHVVTLPVTDHWNEQAHRALLLAYARSLDATFIAIIDADDVPTGNLLPTLRERFQRAIVGRIGIGCWYVPLWGGLDRWRTDAGPWADSLAVIGYPNWHELNHEPRACGYAMHARYPAQFIQIDDVMRGDRSAGMMHLQYASPRRLRAKSWWYRVTERIHQPSKRTPAEANALYGAVLDASAATFEPCPAEWWTGIPERRHIDLDDVPWHEREIERLIGKHGAPMFRGLDLGPYTT